MIELRWMVRMVMRCKCDPLGSEVRVLQYRVGYWFRPATYPDDGMEWRGTVWRDVPEVRE